MPSKRKEIWKSVEGYSYGYEVSNTGKIRRIYKNGKVKELKQSICDGYKILRLGRKNVRVHRIVAQAFIPNPNNYPCVNHKDFNRQNNNVENLEWCTWQYNAEYSSDRFSHIKNTRTGASGEKHIIPCNGKVRLQIRLKRLYFNKVFESKAEAIRVRDELLKVNGYV